MWWWGWQLSAVITFAIGYIMLIVGLSYLGSGYPKTGQSRLNLDDDGYSEGVNRAHAADKLIKEVVQ